MCLAAPAKVISITDNEAVVDYNGVRTTTRLDTLTEPLAPGDYVLIHTGFAIRRLSPEDGEETLKLFDELADSLGANANSVQRDELSSLENAKRSPVGDVRRSDRQAELSSDENAKRSRAGKEQNASSKSES
ncbi:HypC/HybG/HupF family hydrogenase formation chaperone [Candidatus Bipolaricaulota bacterium]|nr:HypC/HybG/HupF family hydrogenase formation chaperone [Candidatus Bipolaricaulota bacterium]TFH11718.1 MAG: HypC/HybG/HupF family hydrogenase formation chaperone [Candidatus Atribacteria bacterium]